MTPEASQTTVVALHGFTRTPRHLATFSEACQRRGWNCLRPALAPRFWPVLMNSRRHLDEVANRLIDSRHLAGDVVMVGHSTGAAAASWITPRLLTGGVDVRGLIYVDGNDTPNHLIEKAWPKLESVPIQAIMAPPNPCNRDGRLVPFLERERPGSVQVIAGAGHGDIEMLGTGAGRRVCKDTSGVSEWRAVQSAVLESVGRFVASY